MIKADKAKEIGLVNDVYAPEELIDKAYELARRITKNAPIAVRYTKNAVNRGVEAPMDEAIRIENDLFAMCFATEDQKEGMNAFLEKRDKVFKNK
jgi:enoyl-CoA hydratase